MTLDEDLNRMKKVKSYKGIRHASGHKVRGQRTYSNGRKGLALGVSKKRAQT
jgi:small subunit ribosomal protein S13